MQASSASLRSRSDAASQCSDNPCTLTASRTSSTTGRASARPSACFRRAAVTSHARDTPRQDTTLARLWDLLGVTDYGTLQRLTRASAKPNVYRRRDVQPPRDEKRLAARDDARRVARSEGGVRQDQPGARQIGIPASGPQGSKVGT